MMTRLSGLRISFQRTAQEGTDHHYRTHAAGTCIGKRKINLSTVFAGQNVGIKQVSDKVWIVSFMQYDLGFFDHETDRVTSAENPFGAKVFPMCPE